MEEHKVPKTFSFPDDPLARHEGLKADREFGSEGQSLAHLRLAALEHARAMPISGEGKWVQLGPTAIPGGQTYSGTRVLVTGRITSILVDPTNSNTIYVGAAQGGIWKTTDRGKTWRPTSDNEVSLAIGALAIDPGDPQTLYAGTGEGNFSGDSYYGNGILKTTDGGNSWTRSGSEPFTRARFCRIVIDPTTPTILFAATVSGPDPIFEGGVYRSMDGGTSWSPMTSGLPSLLPGRSGGATDVMINPQSPQTVYAAIMGKGIYRTDNARAANPEWTHLAHGLPSGGFSRIALGLAPSDPQILYALLANDGDSLIIGFYRSKDGGKTWQSIDLPIADDGSSGLWGQGNYNLNIAVDPTTPDVVYLSAVSLWKATYHAKSKVWTFSDIGRAIHPDHHAFAFDPVDNLHIYTGCDGGIYASHDGGISWSDSLNQGLCITQCEFMDQHPTSDAVIFIGTQDNGMEQYRNSPVFYHALDGDAGFVAIDQNHPQHILGTYVGLTPRLSTQGGALSSWKIVWGKLARIPSGSSLFYPPLALDQSNPNNCAMGGTQVFLDDQQGERGWLQSVPLPLLEANEFVSAINYTHSDLMYVGTTRGKVYRLTRSGNNWVPTLISANSLPPRWIWDIAPFPDNNNRVILVLSGFGTAHVWQGDVAVSGAAAWRWKAISGTDSGRLPDIPVNALVVAQDAMYIGTDAGVFYTSDGGTTWTNYSQGLSNCAVFDMRLHQSKHLLRVATHGRGIWERQLDTTRPDVDIFVRAHLMQTWGSQSFSAEVAAFADRLQHVALGDSMQWWHCADIKIDAPSYVIPEGLRLSDLQATVGEMDYVVFERGLEHRSPYPGRINRVYVQVHNRGVQPAHDITVKVFYTEAAAGLPDLPADFWTAFPADFAPHASWKPVGGAQTIPLLSPAKPAVLEWGWYTPVTLTDHFCYLVVMDCPSDPIPEEKKVLQVATLIANTNHVGLKNVHPVNLSPGKLGTIYWTPLRFSGNSGSPYTITIPKSLGNGWTLALLFPKGTPDNLQTQGMTRILLSANDQKSLNSKLGTDPDTALYDGTSPFYLVDNQDRDAHIADVAQALRVMVRLIPPLIPPPEDGTADSSLSIVQERAGTVVGGSTFALHLIRL